MGGWEKIGKLGIGCEARQRVESWVEAQSMMPHNSRMIFGPLTTILGKERTVGSEKKPWEGT